ncbi:MAG: hypothetical protein NVS3B18_10500 [Candidatus Dormibacteria bacterium]
MSSTFDPGALLARSYVLPVGPRVILRLARIRDLGAIEELFAREGRGLTRLELARLLHSHPRDRLVLCATALIGGREKILGFGAIGLEPPGASPTLVVADSERAPDLGSLVAEALIGRAEALGRTRAA